MFIPTRHLSPIHLSLLALTLAACDGDGHDASIDPTVHDPATTLLDRGDDGGVDDDDADPSRHLDGRPDDGDGDGDAYLPPPTQTRTACVSAQGVLGTCDPSPLVLDCDAAFAQMCMDAGGVLAEIPVPQTSVEVCDDGNEYIIDCSDQWLTTCEETGGTVDCLGEDANGNCTHAQCCYDGEC